MEMYIVFQWLNNYIMIISTITQYLISCGQWNQQEVSLIQLTYGTLLIPLLVIGCIQWRVYLQLELDLEHNT